MQTTYTRANLFTTFNTSTQQYNLQLKGTKATNPAIDTGSASSMPTTDFLGVPRSTTLPDLGAYEAL